MALHFIWYSLWIVPHVFQVAILVVMFQKGLYRQLPVFTAYTSFLLFEFVRLFVISQFLVSSPAGDQKYFFWYSIGLAVYIALQFGVISEIFARVFRQYSAIQNLEKPFFRWATVGLSVLACCLAIYTHRGDADPAWFSTHVLERSATMIQCGLLLLLFLVAFFLHISWPKRVFGIALGLGMLSSVEFAADALRSEIGKAGHLKLDLITMGTYFGCVVIWLYYMIAPERIAEHSHEAIPDHNLEDWSRELQHLLQR